MKREVLCRSITEIAWRGSEIGLFFVFRSPPLPSSKRIFHLTVVFPMGTSYNRRKSMRLISRLYNLDLKCLYLNGLNKHFEKFFLSTIENLEETRNIFFLH